MKPNVRVVYLVAGKYRLFKQSLIIASGAILRPTVVPNRCPRAQNRQERSAAAAAAATRLSSIRRQLARQLLPVRRRREIRMLLRKEAL